MWAHKDFLTYVMTYEAIQKTIGVITKFAEKQAILPLRWIPGYKKDDLSFCHQMQIECKIYNWHTNNTQCHKIKTNSPVIILNT